MNTSAALDSFHLCSATTIVDVGIISAVVVVVAGVAVAVITVSVFVPVTARFSNDLIKLRNVSISLSDDFHLGRGRGNEK